jgi:N-acetylornithine carbamoyltransferase
MQGGFKGADIVYAKTWTPVLTTINQEEGKRIHAKHIDWITDDEILALAAADSIYLYPLPADREIEVANSVIDSSHSVAYDQAENRMHAQKAVMALTMR